MAGILGLFYRDGKSVDRLQVDKMAASLIHRGPDGTSVWVNGCIGLGHLKLITTPESAFEALPLESRDGNCVITSDGRLDNRTELGKLLGIEAGALKSQSDGALILQAYQKWGKECTRYLLGAYVFVIWDDTQKSLFCARDHFGVKPFYYFLNDQVFVFASEIKALFTVSEVPKNINEGKIGDILVSNSNDTQSTFYEGVLRLEAATQMTVGRDRDRLGRYWRLDVSKETSLPSDDAYEEAFRDVFRQAVECRMRTVEPVGTLLSGGLDSSSVTCMARDIALESGASQPHSFSSVFDAVPSCDEREYIQKVIEQGGVQAHFVSADKQSALQPLIEGTAPGFSDQPIFAPNLYVTWQQYAKAKELGITVMLDGFDGDTTVSHGMGYFQELAVQGNWLRFISEAHGYAKMQDHSIGDVLSPYLYRHVAWYRLFKKIYRRAIHREKKVHEEPLWTRLLNPDFTSRARLRERSKAARPAWKTPPKRERDVHYHHLLRGAMVNTNETIDRASSHFGVETWFPFWDKRLVEFCLSLPAEQKLSQGWSRVIMRRSLGGVLPREIQWRVNKSNLSAGLPHVLRNSDKDLMSNAMEDMGKIEQYVNVDAVRDSWKGLLADEVEATDVVLLWRIVALYFWLQQVCDEANIHS